MKRILLLFTLSFILFFQGFFLLRTTLPNRSTFTSTPHYPRLILIIIDALRYDFLSHFSLTSHSLSFRFIADPPTTTLQRLKGLTTGSLPTFIEVGSNFFSTQLQQDHLLRHWNVTFLGDDTWTGLFPDIQRSFPFPSFDVWDLHSVDTAIQKQLYEELEKKPHVLIAHFLGVDHCGHRHGPNHAAMNEKLQEMDGMLNRIRERVDENTLLVVMGDHGMDGNGNHGGDTRDEVEAGILFYTKKGFNRLGENAEMLLKVLSEGGDLEEGEHRAIRQVDVVPTLALLMGTPIPFENLGSVVPELFFGKGEKVLVEAFRRNAKQVESYLNVYYNAQATKDITSEAYESLLKEMKAANDFYEKWKNDEVAMEAMDVVVNYSIFLKSVFKTCLRVWAKFDPVLIIIGSVGMIGCLLLILIHSYGNPIYFYPNRWQLVLINIVGIVFGIMVLKSTSLTLFVSFGASLLFSNLISMFFSFVRGAIKENGVEWINLFPTLVCMLHGIVAGSNSFVVWEDRITGFFLQSILIVNLIRNCHQPKSCLMNFVAMLSVRAMMFFTVCREEQAMDCVPTFFESPSVSHASLNVILIYFACMMLLPFLLRFVFRVRTKSLIVLFSNGCCLCFSYWLLDWIEETRQITGHIIYETKLMLARVYFLGLALAVVYVMYFQRQRKPLHIILLVFLSLIIVQKPPGGLVLIATLYIALFSISCPHSIRLIILYFLSHVAFFSTGHQTTLSTVEWAIAFIGIRQTHYIFSPILVLGNYFGSIILVSVVYLLNCEKRQHVYTWLSVFMSNAVISSAITGLVLRRHLMVWKVFVPRWMVVNCSTFLIIVLVLLRVK